MRDVAQLAGVSLKTVSRVINEEAGVSPERADRVRSAVAQLGFRPNLTASNLRRTGGKTSTIGLLIENIANPFSAALSRAIEDACMPRGVAVFSGSVDEDPERERALVGAFAERRVDGMIIVPSGPDQTYLLEEMRSGTRIVFVDRPSSLPDTDRVIADNRAASADAVGRLIDRGHRRIAHLGDLASIYTARERSEGYRDAHLTAGLPVDPNLVRHGLHDSDAAEAAVRQLLAADDPPTAIFSAQNLITVGAIRALRSSGRSGDVALIGFDDVAMADLLVPGISVIAQDPAGLGRVAAELLLARLDGDTGPAREVVVATSLLERGSGEIRR